MNWEMALKFAHLVQDKPGIESAEVRRKFELTSLAPLTMALRSLAQQEGFNREQVVHYARPAWNKTRYYPGPRLREFLRVAKAVHRGK